MTYEESIKKLEVLAQQMERGDLPIDALAEKLREAQELIKTCRQQLLEADEQVQNILNPKE
ncbi:MAG: exodeoxyribonuclease VII small subunit [Bacteroidaceae bacterium]|nr:exodeoxyribonuclease VII small subunit [Bacteroidaceae bacterium]